MIVGRPLRFLALVTGGWVAARAVMLWPGAVPLATTGKSIVPRALAAGAKPAAHVTRPSVVAYRYRAAAITGPTRPARFLGRSEPRAPGPAALIAPMIPSSRDTGIIAGLPTPLLPPDTRMLTKARSRFFGSAWLFVRGGSGVGAGLSGPQLGGSQAGVRLAYALTADRRLALAARASSPLARGAREVALGLEWQPTRLPVRVIAEQRFAVNGGRGGPTLGLVGGAGPLPVGGGFRLEAYAQAGIIGRDGGEGFGDGAARVARPVATLGGVQIDLGGGAWGAAQKGAARLDIGPSLSARVPLGQQPVRVSLDWRQRVAGNATPGSGLVLTLGADF